MRYKKLKPGMRIYCNSTQEPWMVQKVDAEGFVYLIRTNEVKRLRMQRLMSRYTLVGSAKDILHREACERRGWKTYPKQDGEEHELV